MLQIIKNMSHALFWLPLLTLFIWLAWAGWNEYQKLEAYKLWAVQFERAKYDIYAVLGQKARELTWGVPTRKGPISLETVTMDDVQSVQLWVNEKPVDLESVTANGKAILVLERRDRSEPVRIPFTEPQLAAKWGQYLQQELNVQH